MLSFKQVAGLFVVFKMRRWKSTEGQWSLGLPQGFVPQTSAPVCSQAAHLQFLFL